MYDNNFKLEDGETDWKFIKQFYEEDTLVKHRMKVKCAAQVLSRKVVVGMSTYIWNLINWLKRLHLR